MIHYEIEIDGGNFVLQYEITQDEFDVFMEKPTNYKAFLLAYKKLMDNAKSNFEKDVLSDFWQMSDMYSCMIRIGAWGEN